MYLVYDTYSLILLSHLALFFFFFFNDTATTEIYTLSLHDALPISAARDGGETRRPSRAGSGAYRSASGRARAAASPRSEEHTSELQSLAYLVCRLLLEKKKKKQYLRCMTYEYNQFSERLHDTGSGS